MNTEERRRYDRNRRPQRRRANQLRVDRLGPPSWRRINATLEIWKGFWKKQRGRCRICGARMKPLPRYQKPEMDYSGIPRACLDHDHQTLRLRGLLCHSCNVGLGWYENWYLIYSEEVADYLT